MVVTPPYVSFADAEAEKQLGVLATPRALRHKAVGDGHVGCGVGEPRSASLEQPVRTFARWTTVPEGEKGGRAGGRTREVGIGMGGERERERKSRSERGMMADDGGGVRLGCARCAG